MFLFPFKKKCKLEEISAQQKKKKKIDRNKRAKCSFEPPTRNRGDC